MNTNIEKAMTTVKWKEWNKNEGMNEDGVGEEDDGQLWRQGC